MSFINSWSNSYNSDWGNRFPDDTNTGTENPRTNPERTQRLYYLENKVENLREQVRNCDAKVEGARTKHSNLQYKLSNAQYALSEAQAKEASTGNQQARADGKRTGNKMKLRGLKERLMHTRDSWSRQDLQNEINQRENARWTLDDALTIAKDNHSRARENLFSAESKVSRLDNEVDSAYRQIGECQEDCRARKAQLADFTRELENLRSASAW